MRLRSMHSGILKALVECISRLVIISLGRDFFTYKHDFEVERTEEGRILKGKERILIAARSEGDSSARP